MAYQGRSTPYSVIIEGLEVLKVIEVRSKHFITKNLIVWKEDKIKKKSQSQKIVSQRYAASSAALPNEQRKNEQRIKLPKELFI